jgi:ribosome-associated protein
MIQVTPNITIDESQIEYSFVRASGPGGQHVNKVSSATVLRYDLTHSSLPGDVKQRLGRLAGKRVTKDGTLIIKAQRFRTQGRNQQDALERLIELMRQAATPPKIHIRTKPSRASQEQRLQAKRRRSALKQARRAVIDV